MNIISPIQLKKQGYRFYQEVNDWILWINWEIMEREGSYATGYIEGNGISDKKYVANIIFYHEGGWTPDYDSIDYIEEQ